MNPSRNCFYYCLFAIAFLLSKEVSAAGPTNLCDFDTLRRNLKALVLDFGKGSKVSAQPIARAATQTELENEMKEILSQDPYLEKVSNEARYYTLMQKYQKTIPEYKSVQDLVDAGIVKIVDGEVVTNYVMSQTHLGVLQVEQIANGEFRLIKNRGTPYFRGVDQHASFGSYSALPYIKSAAGKDAYQDIQVIVAVPQDELRKIGVKPTGRELWITSDKLSQIPGVRIFKTKVSAWDFNEYERGR